MKRQKQPVWEVFVDAESREWLTEPEKTDEEADKAEFLSRDDLPNLIHEIYQCPRNGENRLLRVVPLSPPKY